MNTFLTEARQTLVPRSEAKYGPLPPLLVALTLVTGLVDAFSAPFAWPRLRRQHDRQCRVPGVCSGRRTCLLDPCLSHSVSFLRSRRLGRGLLGSRLGQHRGHLLSVAATLQALLLGASVVLAALAGNPVSTGVIYGLIIMLGIAMGLQNATARKLAVPDLTTTVLTLTIVGIAADSRLVGGSGSKAGRCLIAVGAMFVGALLGSLLIFHVSIVAPLVIAFIVKVMIAGTARVLSRTDPVWVHAS